MNQALRMFSLSASCFLVLLLAPALSAAPAAAVGGGDFEDCGLLVQGPVCVQFLADSGGVYYVEDLGPFAPGHRVRVIGAVFNSPGGCVPINCTAVFTGCVLSNIIELCGSSTLICFGDGGVSPGCTLCPCGNESRSGLGGGCINSSGTSGKLITSGEPRIGADTLRIEARDVSPGTFAILISGDNALPAAGMCPPGSGIQTAVFDGLRCAGGNLRRHGIRPTDSLGRIGVTTPGWGLPDGPGGGLSGQGGFSAGQTRVFQIIYRDDATLVCLTGQNTTNAAEVIFVP